MKKYVLLALLAASTAHAYVSELPSTLHCVSAETSAVSEISISQLEIGSDEFEYEVPADSALEGSDNSLNTTGGATVITISNGCDNSYHLYFSNQDLVELARGKKTSITAMQKFSHPGYGDEYAEETVLVNCTL